MAQRTNKKIITATPTAKKSGSDDLTILHPNQTRKIAGINITVREYGWVEGLKLRELANPILLDIEKLMVDGTVPDFDQLRVILGKHYAATLQLIAQAADVDVEFLETLNQRDGELIEAVWWGCNGPFFMHSVIKNISDKRMVKILRGGRTSTPSSSPTAITQSE